MLRNAMRRFGAAAVCALILSATAAHEADAALITLSTHSTTQSIPPSMLAADMDFTVAGDTLLITVTNHTSGQNSFLINQVFFNATAELSNLEMTSAPDGWSLSSTAHAGGYGHFTFGLFGGVGANSAAIRPGHSATFAFSLEGSNLTEATFISGLSSGPKQMIVAAKFIVGPGDISSFGGWVPAPSAALTMLALLIAGWPRRRRQ